ncbi:NAD(P)H-hydrate dehydratase [Candidatus Roizmanbacteria bacterium CG_4_10_14_0_2_um_filter_36_35]|uniref:ADP-dependent (S)-NAD(P)H-hydrate dehydratase n=5 Tax=Candidatus Roizmaniibacteriota TaxID=1752723 RepID=A0A2M7BX31_9BACT|nr:MAG: NAD(P)H-hydrate dehydratase [Candidatus Roizmanbacteria bacterium CG11_big_fil_rev_8_21_14_0_20_35_14]PIV11133.1 MAG: NAD(P)H-hydrate dehydratase [Candidatus Roizmanbacteria bacterium CG03_land_8_20_14_0_80_35_26]PIZ66917.1 MAG: NAD(P)H-hydrate dehydratase [Candidatus Roizmanbacteria bacterium CG_4_10_14_0_2_um_filter_36_35]PJC33541.1 MAG: NAD(P)H-hydrate dehydratase [Candidatus Roizmanbacteria bacterium CG_4_9_14_0_2_um_filter_36_12]PJC81804.1 MAG: NAD(P)H-hydrate dehydratase [Candidat
MVIKISDINSIKSLFKKFTLPQPNSHKGQNGKVLIIGGSSLFHAASLWAAEVCSHFIDMVHYSSTKENEEIFLNLKKKFRNGIIVPQKELEHYVKEDDAVLMGPGMMRDGEEGKYTYELTKKLMEEFPDKRFVFDAGALQMMEKDWLLKLKTPAIITPHQKEFERLFDVSIHRSTIDEKQITVKKMAKEYKTVILLKAIVDIISDGKSTYIVEGGNAGLTKGGTGDVLAGLATSFYTKSNVFDSAVFASVLLKLTADELFKSSGYWYNVDDIINKLPNVLMSLRGTK